MRIKLVFKSASERYWIKIEYVKYNRILNLSWKDKIVYDIYHIFMYTEEIRTFH